MLGEIILALTVIQADPSNLPKERIESSYCWAGDFDTSYPKGGAAVDARGNLLGVDTLPCVPIACVPTYCEEYEIRGSDLVCYDSDETYPAGHWTMAYEPDFGEYQVTVEY